MTMASLTLQANTAPGFKTLSDGTQAASVSASGRYVVGYNPTVSMYGINMSSFVYDRQTDNFSWQTAYDAADLTKGGGFTDVADNGVICGSAKNPDLVVKFTDWDGTQIESPINTAAVWKDGTCTRLGYGTFDTSKFTNLEDGTFATGISSDGKTVAGYAGTGNAAVLLPCEWTETDGGAWTMTMLPLPDGCDNGRAYAISADGSRVLGEVSSNSNGTKSAGYWQNGSYTALDLGKMGVKTGDYVYFNGMSMSRNGRFIAVSMSTNGVWIYDADNDTYKKIPEIEANRLYNDVAVDNNGNAVAYVAYGSAFFGGEVYNRPCWYSYSTGRVLDLSYFMQVAANGVEPDFSLKYTDKTQAATTAVSADGKVILGSTDTQIMAGQTPKAWILEVESTDVTVPDAPQGLKGVSDKLGEVTVSWLKDKNTYSGLTLKSYNLYCDGSLVKQVDITADDELSVHLTGLSGHPVFTVEAVFEKEGGGTLPSPISDELTVSLPDTYALPLFEDFDSNTIETNYWTLQDDYGNSADLSWNPLAYFALSGSCLYTSVSTGEPYSQCLVSRPLDATDASSVYITFALASATLNSPGQDYSSDYVAVETSADNGKTWKKAGAWSIDDVMNQHNWGIKSVDLTADVAGKMFTARIHRYGEGKSQFIMCIDNLKIGTVPEQDAPQGLTGMPKDGGKSVQLAWKAADGAYQLNYIKGIEQALQTAGNEGNEMIAVNAFDAADLDLYNGKYLTGVKTMINYYDWVEAVKGIHASVVVYQNDKLVREQAVPSDVQYNTLVTIPLDEPLLIDNTKNLKFGLKIYDYDEGQIPVTYMMTDSFVAGKSDLYSTDGGATWLKLSDFYAAQGNEEQGHCVWYFSGVVADSPDFKEASANEPLAYNVYRNGEIISASSMNGLQTSFTDAAPLADGSYCIEAYYGNGDKSKLSDCLTMSELAAISPVVVGDNSVTLDRENNEIRVNGDFSKATLVSVDGTAAAVSCGNAIPLCSVKAGVYVLQIEKNGNVSARKILIGR